MKTSRILIVLLLILSTSLSSSAAEKNFQKILGVWEFSAPNAPQPYDGGTLTLKEVDQKLAGEFTVQGQPLTIPQIEFVDNILTLGFEVESTPVTLKLTFKDGQFEGSTDTPNGVVTVTAKPAKTTAK